MLMLQSHQGFLSICTTKQRKNCAPTGRRGLFSWTGSEHIQTTCFPSRGPPREELEGTEIYDPKINI